MPPVHFKTTPWRSAATAVALAALAACGQSTPAPESEVIRPAYVTEVRATDASGLAFTGEVRAVRRAELAFAVSGRVTQVLVEPGDGVRQGQALARLDELPLKAQLATASAELQRGEAQFNDARQRMERLRLAQKSDAVSAAEVGAMQAELASAEGAVRGARAQRDSAVWSLEQATLRAPLDGVVAARHLEPGQAGGPGAPVLTVDGAGRELALLVPLSQPLKVGQPVKLRDGMTQLTSKVLRVGGRLEAGGVRKVFLAMPDDAAVGSTWSATISAVAPPETTAWVPLRAVLPGSATGTGSVLRLVRDGRTTELATVRLGATRNDWVEVSDGLIAGDRVVVAGATAIKPGSAIKPIDMPGLETLP